MCLFYNVRPMSPSDRARIASWGQASMALEWTTDPGREWPTLSLHACDMVREWDRQSGWKLPKQQRSSLHADLSKLFGELTGVLELTATWSSDAVDKRVELTRTDVLNMVLANRIANQTVYTVSN